MALLKPKRRTNATRVDVHAAFLVGGMALGCAVTLLIFWVIR